jgi:hypothetical protein
MRLLQPDYVLVDEAIGCDMTPGPLWTGLNNYVVEHCDRVGEVSGAWAGDAGKATSLLGQSTAVYRCGA